jgi:hypothetical protein
MNLKNTMIGIILALAIFGIFQSFRPVNQIKGNGKIIKEYRPIRDFQELEAGSIFRIYYTPSDTFSLLIETDENIMPEIKAKVKNGRLKLSIHGDISNITKLNVYLSAPFLSALDMSGASSFKATKKIKSNIINLKFSGASNGKMELDCKTLDIDISGASWLILNGQSRTMSIKAGGASKLKCEKLDCEIARIDASGASAVYVNVNKQINIEASGAAQVNYITHDNAAIKINTSGVASVSKKD